jgi:hypothetical protein
MMAILRIFPTLPPTVSNSTDGNSIAIGLEVGTLVLVTLLGHRLMPLEIL